MKKTIYTLAFTLMGAYSFAENDVHKRSKVTIEEAFGTCTVTIYTKQKGRGYMKHTYEYEASTALDCFNSARAVIAAHKRKKTS